MNEELHIVREDREAAKEWAAKFDVAAGALVKIGPKFITSSANLSGHGYHIVFPDPEFRQQIERHVIEFDPSRNRFSARHPTSDQLRLPVVQQTVQRVLDALTKFREEHPEDAKKLGLKKE